MNPESRSASPAAMASRTIAGARYTQLGMRRLFSGTFSPCAAETRGCYTMILHRTLPLIDGPAAFSGAVSDTRELSQGYGLASLMGNSASCGWIRGIWPSR